MRLNQQNGCITIREFLMAAAYQFEPVEVEFQDHNAEELNCSLVKVRVAFEAFLYVSFVCH